VKLVGAWSDDLTEEVHVAFLDRRTGV